MKKETVRGVWSTIGGIAFVAVFVTFLGVLVIGIACLLFSGCCPHSTAPAVENAGEKETHRVMCSCTYGWAICVCEGREYRLIPRVEQIEQPARK